MTSTVRCPKCSSNAHAFLVRHPFIYNKSELQVSCQFCGTRKYGEDATRLVEAAKEEAARKELERKELAARKEAERVEAERKEAERVEAERKEAERVEAERQSLAARKEASRKARPPQSAPAPATERKTEGDNAVMLEEIKHLEAKAAARMLDARAKNDRAELARLRREQLVAARAIAINYKGVEALCASPWCANPRPIDRRYCEKKCSDDVARERYLEKKNRTPAP